MANSVGVESLIEILFTNVKGGSCNEKSDKDEIISDCRYWRIGSYVVSE